MKPVILFVDLFVLKIISIFVNANFYLMKSSQKTFLTITRKWAA